MDVKPELRGDVILRAKIDRFDTLLSNVSMYGPADAVRETWRQLKGELESILSSLKLSESRSAALLNGECAAPTNQAAEGANQAADSPSSLIGSPKGEKTVICERCQVRVPERLATFGIGVRAGRAAWCAACKPIDGPERASKRAEVIAIRRSLIAAGRPGEKKSQ